MSFSRIIRSGFFTRWKKLTLEEKLKNDDFQRIFGDLQSNQCSVYKGDGSEDFSRQIAAASCIPSQHVQTKDVFVLRTTDGCLMIIEQYGTMGIDSVDRCHYNLGGISQDKLLKIFDSVTNDDVHHVLESDIYPILVKWEQNDSSLKDKYSSIFSSNTLQKLERSGGGPY